VRQTDGRPMTQRDVNRRCVACGRRPDEECCVDCHRSFDYIQPQTFTVCSVDGCFNAHTARGYCATHYSRWQTNDGDAFPDVPVGDTTRPLALRRVEAV
jgi:hypothetical protein